MAEITPMKKKLALKATLNPVAKYVLVACANQICFIWIFSRDVAFVLYYKSSCTQAHAWQNNIDIFFCLVLFYFKFHVALLQVMVLKGNVMFVMVFKVILSKFIVVKRSCHVSHKAICSI